MSERSPAYTATDPRATAIAHHFDRLLKSANTVAFRLALSREMMRLALTILENTMADQTALAGEIEKLKGAVSDYEAREAAQAASNQATIGSLTATVADLKAKLETGVDLQPQIDAIEGIIASIPAAPGAPAAAA